MDEAAVPVQRSRHREIECDKIKAFSSKGFIDRIDRALATHYDFTAEELASLLTV